MLKSQNLSVLKKALGYENNENITYDMLSQIAEKRSYDELYLVAYLVDSLSADVPDLQERNALYGRMYNYLDLDVMHNKKICNMVIYTLCCTDACSSEFLSDEDVYLNFDIMHSWLKKQKVVEFDNLNIIEKYFVLLLSNGYTADNIFEDNMMEDFGDLDYIKEYMFKTFPEKCGVNSLIQAMAVVFIGNPELRDVEKSLDMYDKYIKK